MATRDASNDTGWGATIDAPVGTLRGVGADGVTSEHSWVDCPLRGGPVSTRSCAACDRCAAISYDQAGRVRRVQCYPLPEATRPEQGVTHRLSLEIPTVDELMTRQVLCMLPDLPLARAIELFAEHGFHAAPVVDAQGTLLGMLGEADIVTDVHLHGEADADPLPRDLRELSSMHVVPATRTVGDAMLPIVFSVPQGTRLTRASALMAYEGLQRVVVCAMDGRVVGILSASDVMRWLAAADGFHVAPIRHADAE